MSSKVKKLKQSKVKKSKAKRVHGGNMEANLGATVVQNERTQGGLGDSVTKVQNAVTGGQNDGQLDGGVLTFKQFAEKVLLETGTAMTAKEIWDYGVKRGWRVNTGGKTPWATINALLYLDMMRHDDSRFERQGKTWIYKK